MARLRITAGGIHELHSDLQKPVPAFSYGVLVQVGIGVRYERAMARDGETYRPYWNMWAAQEEQLFEDYGSYYTTSPGWPEGPDWVYRTG